MCSQSSLWFARACVNTGTGSSLGVYVMFLQLYQERCVNGCAAGWVAGSVSADEERCQIDLCVVFQMTSPSRRRTGWRASTLSVPSAGGPLR